MNAKTILVVIAAIATWSLTACTYTFGECWRRGERGKGSDGAGAGTGDGSVTLSSGAGDYGDAPGKQNDDQPIECNKTIEAPKKETPKETTNSPQDPCPGASDMAGDGAVFLSCSDACSSKCPPPGMGGLTYVDFDPSDFPFVTIIHDDGTDKGAGWQEAKANLKFKHVMIPGGTTEWYCPITIGMPLRTEKLGRIDPIQAANLSEEVTEDVANLMDYTLPPGIFCKRFAMAVDATFKSKYKGLGAKAASP